MNTGETNRDEADLTAGSNQDVAFLDSALWSRLQKATTLEDFAAAWLALQCAFVTGASSAVIVLKEFEAAALAPVAYWPKDAAASVGLTEAADAAIEQNRAVVRINRNGAQSVGDVAFPILIDGDNWGVLAIEIHGATSNDELKQIVRQLQWGAGWVESWLNKSRRERARDSHKRIEGALDFIGDVIGADNFKAACSAMATALSTKFLCDRVSVGYRGDGKRSHIVAMSHMAQFDERMNLSNSLAQLMDECLDQWTSIRLPGDDGTVAVTRSHEKHIREFDCDTILTVPIVLGDKFVGALSLERAGDNPFSDVDVKAVTSLSILAAPLLEEKRLNSLNIFERGKIRIATAAKAIAADNRPASRIRIALLAALALFLIFGHGNYKVTADARVDALSRRVISAPFGGFIKTADARAGVEVREGAVLAEMDTEELMLEEARLIAERGRLNVEYAMALTLGERAKINIAQAQIQQTDAQLQLAQEKLRRGVLRAPYDGVVILGDLTANIGGAVRQGEPLFEVAPLDGYRVLLNVDERDVLEIETGQIGRLAISSLPGRPYDIIIDRVTPVSDAIDGKTIFQVEATLTKEADLARLRPGMSGAAKVSVGDRHIVWIWTHRFTEWLQLKLWRWFG